MNSAASAFQIAFLWELAMTRVIAHCDEATHCLAVCRRTGWVAGCALAMMYIWRCSHLNKSSCFEYVWTHVERVLGTIYV